jgi:hypothetical protein
MPESALPPHLRGLPHTDWPWPFSRIKRGVTAWAWGEPKLLAGSQDRKTPDGVPMPIGEPGSFQVSYYPDAPLWARPFAWCIAFTLPGGRHFRLGARWDDVDGYVQWPSIASRKFPPDGQRDTSA